MEAYKAQYEKRCEDFTQSVVRFVNETDMVGVLRERTRRGFPGFLVADHAMVGVLTSSHWCQIAEAMSAKGVEFFCLKCSLFVKAPLDFVKSSGAHGDARFVYFGEYPPLMEDQDFEFERV